MVSSLTIPVQVLVMALPIPIVVDNFADYYSEQKKLEAKEQKREAQMKQAEFDCEAERLANRPGIRRGSIRRCSRRRSSDRH